MKNCDNDDVEIVRVDENSSSDVEMSDVSASQINQENQ